MIVARRSPPARSITVRAGAGRLPVAPGPRPARRPRRRRGARPRASRAGGRAGTASATRTRGGNRKWCCRYTMYAGTSASSTAGPSTSTARSRGRHCIATSSTRDEHARPTARRSARRRDRRAPAPRPDRGAGARRPRCGSRRARHRPLEPHVARRPDRRRRRGAPRRRRTSAQPTIARHSSAASSEIQSAAHTWRCGVHSSTTSNDACVGCTSQPFA